MKLTSGFEQAVCIIALLSTQDREIPVTSHSINKLLQVSPTYLKKLFRKLVVADLVKSVSGNSGGFTLAKSPEDISLRDIVEALEGPINSYPDTGVANRVFGDMQRSTGVSIVKQGDILLKEAFADADQRWLKSLETQTIKKLIQSALGMAEIPEGNWNQKGIDGQDEDN